ncbi:PKD domain-containing protein [Geodermatophilus marinus]|nr:PKD domain-containing protein [Geodermatophilus sp. LHW52908]
MVASDAAGNELASSWVTATVGAANSGPSGTYGDLVAADGASAHWSLGELSGSTAYDRVGTRDMTMNSGVTRNQAGALAGDGGTAFSFNGTSTGFLATTAAATSPQVFSVEAWVQTTSRTGGKIVGYGNRATGTSTSYDRHVFMDAAGRLHFGVWNGAQQRVGTTATYNDGRWHHVVASLSHRGMELYVDGVLAGTRPQVTAANPYSGFWRVGGDRGWQSAAEFFAGQIDEVAVYPTALSAQQVAGHNTTGRTGQVPNTAPSAVFSAAVADLAVAVDGSGSADADGSVASYAWEFGDGGTGTGVTASHGYAAAGSYTVRLTVTDDDGATASTSRVVTVTAPAAEPEPQPEPQPGDGALAVDAFDREVVSGWGTADRGGAWTVGGSGSTSVTGGAGQLSAEARRNASALLAGVSSLDAAVQAELVVPELATGGGTYVSVATRRGGTSDYRLLLRYRGDGVVEVMLARHVNGVETILTGTALSGGYSPGQSVTVRFETEGTGTTTLRAKAWASGAPEPAAWLVTGTDSTAALQREGAVFLYEYVSGSATRASTVRVDDLWVGAAGTAPGEPTGTPVDPAPVNQAPSASFTAVPTELSAAFDGSGSADADGSVASYAWEFGDGGTGTGVTASHGYAAAGSYTVRLTVTDDDGATASTSRVVTVTAPASEPEPQPEPQPGAEPIAADAFGREVTGGFGQADLGGSWTTYGGAANVAVTDGAGRLTANPGTSVGGLLGVTAADVAVQADVVLERTPTGGGMWVSLGTRDVGGTRYKAQLWFAADGRVRLELVRVVDWAETFLTGVTLPGTYTPGTALTVRYEVGGDAPAALRAKAWTAGTVEPDWQVQATDGTVVLQRAGGLKVDVYTARSATAGNAVRFDDLWVGPAGQAPQAR